jgi:hypothetical protein
MVMIQKNAVAKEIPFDPTGSTLTSTQVEAAIKEIASAVASGILNYNIVSSTGFATTSNTEVLVTGFQVTPVAGTYGVWASAAMQSTASGSTLQGSLYKAGSVVADSTRNSRVAASNANIVFSTMSIIQVNGSQTIDMRVSTTSATMTVGNRSLILIRLGP